MKEEEYAEMVSVLDGAEGYSDEYAGIREFKQQLKEVNLVEEQLDIGWVLCEENGRNKAQDKIILVLKHLILSKTLPLHCLIQFWAVGEVEDRQNRYRLSTKNQPFCIFNLAKGLSWYRNQCTDYVYHGVEGECEGEGDEDEHRHHHGGVERAYLNRHPESTPDLRHYSTKEFTMRDEAAHCGFRGYLALPVFAVRTLYGVLELLSRDPVMDALLLSSLVRGLQMADMRCTHTNSVPINHSIITMRTLPPNSEIREIVELAFKAISKVYLAQVWVPCKQCPRSATKCCMERASFQVHLNCGDDKDMLAYLQASEFHNLQRDLASFHRDSSCDLSIAQNPLAHYAVMARLCFWYKIYLQSVHDQSDSCVIEFFIQPDYTQDAHGDYSLHLLLKMVESKLQNYRFSWGGQQLPKHLKNAIDQHEYSFDTLKVMNSCKDVLAEPVVMQYFEMVELDIKQVRSFKHNEQVWIFCKQTQEDGESLLTCARIVVKQKIKHFLEIMAASYWTTNYCMVQFWAPTTVGDKSYLETSYQPYALGDLAKGLVSFRKESMDHYYCVDDETKEEELGPPGRVFKNRLPEITPDISFYSTQEFLFRTYALHCDFHGYFALPVFLAQDEQKCVGVLELIEFDYCHIYCVQQALEEVGLCLTIIDSLVTFLAGQMNSPGSVELSPNVMDFHPSSSEKIPETNDLKRKAVNEVKVAFNLIRKIPQLYMAVLWVPHEESINTMVLAASSENTSKLMPSYVHVQPKKGIIGMALASESKACFCRNLRGFSITDQPLSHYEMSDRRDVCLAICLQSSLTRDLVYVLELYLYQGPATYEYLNDFLNFLLPIMQKKLITFKMASGKQLGAEFMVEVIEFLEANKPTSSLMKFKIFPYGRKEREEEGQQQVQSISYATHPHPEEGLDTIDGFKKTKRKKKTQGPPITDEDLRKHCKMLQKDAAEVMGASIGKVKRAQKRYRYDSWRDIRKKMDEESSTSFLSEREDFQPSSNSNLVVDGLARHVITQEGETEKVMMDLQPSSSSNPQLLDESSQRVIMQEGAAEKVIVRVKNAEKDTIRFEFCLSLGVANLFQQVATRLSLEQGTFKLKYVDEDKIVISLTSKSTDTDMQLCPKTGTATGKTCMDFFL